jgi:hypothetical protein
VSLLFAGVFYLLDHLRQMSFSLNDAFAAVKTSDGFIDREKFEHFWGIMPDDKKGGKQRESARAIKTLRKRFERVRAQGYKRAAGCSSAEKGSKQ